MKTLTQNAMNVVVKRHFLKQDNKISFCIWQILEKGEIVSDFLMSTVKKIRTLEPSTASSMSK